MTASMAALFKFRPFVIAALAYMLFVQGLFLGLGVRKAITGVSDFRQLYAAGYLVRTGAASHLYDYDLARQTQLSIVGPELAPLAFNHLAYEALLFAPLSFFSFRVAYALFFLSNLVLIGVSFWFLRRHYSAAREFWYFLPASFFACFLPLGIALLQGQDSILLLTCLACSLALLETRREMAAGAFLSLGLFKFQFILPIALLFLVWKKWRFMAGFLAGAGLVTLVSVATTGLSGVRDFLSYMNAISTGLSTVEQQFRYSIHPAQMPNLRGMIYGLASSQLPHAALQVLTFLFSAALLVWAAQRRASFPLAVAVAFFVSYHALIHDAAILLLPLIGIVDSRPPTWRLALLGAAFAAPTLAASTGIHYWLVGPVAFAALFLGSPSNQKVDMEGELGTSQTTV